MDQSNRMKSVQDPIIPLVSDWILDNPGTISLGQGIVSYPPPPQVEERIKDFYQNPALHAYQAVEGIPELRNLIQRKLAEENQIFLRSEKRLVITAGSNMAFSHAVLAIADEGDEIILLTPCYFNHEMALTMAGVKVISVPTQTDYLPGLERVKAAISDRTRAIVTVSPNNPTGQVYPESLLGEINQLCRERKLYHIHDEAYEYFVYDGHESFSPGSIEGSESYTLSLFSLSKAFGFASWRIGYMVIPEQLFNAIRKIQDTQLICPPVISQYAALGAMEGGHSYVKTQLPKLEKLRKKLLQGLKPLTQFCKVSAAEGALYIWLELPEGTDELEIAKALIYQYKVAVIPGGTFGAEQPSLRLSFGALDEEMAELGITRLCAGIPALLA